ncbi:MAG: Rid family detoxifying hydrolase [Candidatus Micrarchaeia archaeon]
MKNVSSEGAPKAIGPYSHAVISHDLVFVSGQIGVDANGELGDGIEEQTENAISNISTILKAAGSSLDKVVKTTVYLTNMSDFAKMNTVYERHFRNKPARATVGVASLPKGAVVEIEAVAEL